MVDCIQCFPCLLKLTPLVVQQLSCDLDDIIYPFNRVFATLLHKVLHHTITGWTCLASGRRERNGASGRDTGTGADKESTAPNCIQRNLTDEIARLGFCHERSSKDEEAQENDSC